MSPAEGSQGHFTLYVHLGYLESNTFQGGMKAKEKKKINPHMLKQFGLGRGLTPLTSMIHCPEKNVSFSHQFWQGETQLHMTFDI